MRFSLSLPTDRVDLGDEFVHGEAVMQMAVAAEQAGFDAVFVTEHPIPGDEWLASGGHHALDPFVALSFAAAATTSLRLQTNLAVVPYRNPFLLAKAVASLDVLSGGRMIFGCGAGYLETEFDALGVAFDNRNDRFDESLATMKQVWSGESVAIKGAGFVATGNTALPRPAQQPHPPIWVGGNSTKAIRRAVELGDGWMPMPAPAKAAARVRSAPLASLDDLAARLAIASRLADEVGRREPLDVMFMPITTGPYGHDGFSLPALAEEIRRQSDLGVTQMAVGFAPHGPAGKAKLTSRRQFLDLTAAFGAEVISTPAGG
jgi:probable F420-dependent oxidoreductase